MVGKEGSRAWFKSCVYHESVHEELWFGSDSSMNQLNKTEPIPNFHKTRWLESHYAWLESNIFGTFIKEF